MPRLKPRNTRWRLFCASSLAIALLSVGPSTHAGPIRDRIMAHLAARQEQGIEDGGDTAGRIVLPPAARLIRDVAYGPDERQRMDIYLPRQAVGAPVILMVHGGAWRWGDKSVAGVVENKMSRWVSQGFIFISTNYRMLPKANPLEQAQDVAAALATAQGKAIGWGGDPAKFILMGHSAGAHLVALLTASPALALESGAQPWLGTVALDSAALDVVQIMEAQHYRLYDQPFGSAPAFWRTVSPFHQLAANARPLLAVCSTRRNDPCPQARKFAEKAALLHVQVRVLEQNLSHGEINQDLGLEGAYTEAVEGFMGSLDPSVMQMLSNRQGGVHQHAP